MTRHNLINILLILHSIKVLVVCMLIMVELIVVALIIWSTLVVVLIETINPALMWSSLLLRQTTFSLGLLNGGLLGLLVCFLSFKAELTICRQACPWVWVVIKWGRIYRCTVCRSSIILISYTSTSSGH